MKTNRELGIRQFNDKRFAHLKSVDILVTPSYNNVTNVMEAKYRQHLPGFFRLIAKHGTPGLDLAKYAILMYDRQSPFIVEHPMLDGRKKAAAHYVGLGRPQAQQHREWAMSLGLPELVDFVSDYLRWQDNLLWSLIVQYEEMFYSNQKQILSAITSEQKDTDRMNAATKATQLLGEQRKLQREISALWAEYTGNDPNAAFRMKERKPMLPEVVAEHNVDLHALFRQKAVDEEE